MRFHLAPHIRSRLLNYGLFFLFGLISFIRVDYKPAQSTIIQELMVSIVAPGQRLIVEFNKAIQDFYNHYLNVVSTGKENELLRSRVQELTEEVFQLNYLAQENARLKSLWELASQVEGHKIFAQVIGTDPNREYKMLRIDKGAQNGIHPKDSVVTVSGLVGHIYRVFDQYSDVLTILDSNNRSDVRIERTRTAGVLEGSGFQMCRLKYLALSEDVVVGDLLVTAGFAKLYPKGIRVGMVTSVKSESHMMTKAIEVRPVVDFTKLEEVIVLVKEKRDEQ